MQFGKFVKIGLVAAMTLTTATAVHTSLGGDAAYAKSDKSKDKGSNGNGRSKDKSKRDKASKSDKSNGRSKGGASSGQKRTLMDLFKSPEKAKPVRQKAPAKQQKTKVVKAAPALVETDPMEEEYEGVKKKNINAALGALNAANASEQAFQNASPNSRVGRIAAYRDQVLETEALREDLDEAEALLDLLTAPDLSAEDYEALRLTELERKEALEQEIAELTTALNAVGGENEELETALDGAIAALEAQNSAIDALDEDYASAQSYWEAEDILAERQEELDAQQALADELLAAAANKPITDDVVAEVHRLLGLPEPIFEDDELAKVTN